MKVVFSTFFKQELLHAESDYAAISQRLGDDFHDDSDGVSPLIATCGFAIVRIRLQPTRRVGAIGNWKTRRARLGRYLAISGMPPLSRVQRQDAAATLNTTVS